METQRHTTKHNDKLLTAAELAAFLAVDKHTVYGYRDAGCPAILVGRSRGYRFDRQAVLDWLRDRAA